MNNAASPEFSADFARHLRDVMAENRVSQVAIAEHLDRSQSYVSEHINGVRPTSVDVVQAVAALAGIPARQVMVEILDRMGSTA